MSEPSQIVVILDCKTVFENLEDVLNSIENASFTVVQRKRMVLDDKTARIILTDPTPFLAGAVEVLQLSHEDPYLNFPALGLEIAYGSTSEYTSFRDHRLLFPEDHLEKLERTVAIIKPGYSEMDLDAIRGTIEADLFVIIDEKNTKLSGTQCRTIYGEASDQIVEYNMSGESRVMVLEKVGAIGDWRLIIGPEDPGRAKIEAPESLRSRFGEDMIRNCLYGSKTEQDYARDINVLYGDVPFQVEKTLALIKPDVAENDAGVSGILAEMGRFGFSIVEKRKFRMSKQRAEEFYAEHSRKPFFDPLTTFMASGPIIALVLAKAAAIKSWRLLMGPTNSDTAKETRPDSLRAKFGTDGRRNAVHGSDSTESANREILFMFPKLAQDSVPTDSEIRKTLQIKADVRPQHTLAKPTLNQVLISGLTELSKAKPENPVKWLGQWLVDNNPNKPKIDERRDKTPRLSVAAELSDKNGGAPLVVVFVLGGPGCGKGTQCDRIVKDYHFTHISAGDCLREEQRKDSKASQLIKEYIAEGQLVPTALIVSLLKKKMLELGKTRYLIDGFPREMEQALEFETQICSCNFVLFFSCSEETMRDRIKLRSADSGRADDNLETLVKRFKVFEYQSMPVIEHYTRFGKVRIVDAEQSVDQVYSNVQQVFAGF